MRSAVARSWGSSIWGLALLACLVIAVGTLYDVIGRYRRFLAMTQAELGTVALAVEGQASTTVGAIDSILKLLAANFEARQSHAADFPPERAVLSSGSFISAARYVYFDGSGKVIDPPPEPADSAISVKDRAYFTVQGDLSTAGLYVGAPIKGRRTGRWYLPISRRLSGPGGGFGGVVVAFVDPAYFRRFYGTLDLGPSGSLMLATRDGVVVARSGEGAPATGDAVGDRAAFRSLVSGSTGSGLAKLPIDGADRLFAYRVVPGTDLVVLATRGFTQLMRRFAQAVAPLGLAALAAIAIILGLSRAAVRRLGSRLVAIGRETEKRHAEAIAAARARLDEILEGIDPVVWSCDTSGRLVYVSRRAATVFGQDVGAMLDWPDRFAGCVDDADRERVLAAWRDWHRAQNFEVEYRCRHPDGSTRWIRDRARLMTDEKGHQWIDGTSTDVTRAKAAEDALRRSEERLRSVLETMPDGVVVLDATGAVELANPAARAMFGRSGGLDGTPVERLFVRPGKDWLPVAPGAAPPVRLLEAEARHEPGGTFPAEVSVGHFLHDVGDHAEASTVLAVRDVTEKAQAARRMLHAQRMEAIGRLTSAVFHDFHNLLLVIELNLDMLRAEQRSAAERQSLVEPALHAARTCMELTRQLVDFSRRPDGKQSVVNVAEALRSVLPMLKGAATPAIDLDLRIDWPVWGARLDPHALDAAVVNLLVNARDAMPSGGRAEITIRNRVLVEALETRLVRIPPGDYVECAVADSGVGIPDDALDKVVEPFFTTKTIKGTGLGLSNVYNFVRAMNGHMIIESHVGKGTRVALLFPAVVGESLKHEEQGAGAPRSAG